MGYGRRQSLGLFWMCIVIIDLLGDWSVSWGEGSDLPLTSIFPGQELGVKGVKGLGGHDLGRARARVRASARVYIRRTFIPYPLTPLTPSMYLGL